MIDQFMSMSELIDHTEEHKDWQILYNERVAKSLITAVHGGAIERGTSEIAQLISEIGGYSFYTFKGIRKNKNHELHVTSKHFDEPILNELVPTHKAVVSLHGCMGDDVALYIGGKDLELSYEITQQLQKIGIKVKPAPAHIAGMQTENFVNKGKRDAGVQLELTVALRKQCFKNNKYNLHDRENRENWSQLMFSFSTAIANALKILND